MTEQVFFTKDGRKDDIHIDPECIEEPRPVELDNFITGDMLLSLPPRASDSQSTIPEPTSTEPNQVELEQVEPTMLDKSVWAGFKAALATARRQDSSIKE